jgi:hypothetical protein
VTGTAASVPAPRAIAPGATASRDGLVTVVAALVTSVAAVTIGFAADVAEVSLIVVVIRSPGILPSQAITLASANPNTNEITREVASFV